MFFTFYSIYCLEDAEIEPMTDVELHCPCFTDRCKCAVSIAAYVQLWVTLFSTCYGQWCERQKYMLWKHFLTWQKLVSAEDERTDRIQFWRLPRRNCTPSSEECLRCYLQTPASDRTLHQLLPQTSKPIQNDTVHSRCQRGFEVFFKKPHLLVYNLQKNKQWAHGEQPDISCFPCNISYVFLMRKLQFIS